MGSTSSHFRMLEVAYHWSYLPVTQGRQATPPGTYVARPAFEAAFSRR